MRLSREGLICGPSSGFNLQGLYQFLEAQKAKGALPNSASEDKFIRCVFICCDLPYQYLDEYFDKLGEEDFHPVMGEVRIKTQQQRKSFGCPLTYARLRISLV